MSKTYIITFDLTNAADKTAYYPKTEKALEKKYPFFKKFLKQFMVIKSGESAQKVMEFVVKTLSDLGCDEKEMDVFVIRAKKNYYKYFIANDERRTKAKEALS